VTRCVLALVLVSLAVGGVRVRGQQAVADQMPTFRASVDLVSVAAVVRDRRGQIVRNLTRDDFQVYDTGVPRPILEFSADEAGPVSIALLVDVSGSMQVAKNLAAARRVVDHVLAWVETGRDEIGLFSFDRELYENQAFTTDPAAVRAAFDRLEAYGMTSLYDAIGLTARQLMERPSKRRAVVILTDGEDNASRLSPDKVSSSVVAADMPVYVIAVVSAVDRTDGPAAVKGRATFDPSGPLGNLCYWTGGTMFTVTTDAEASVAARTLLAELRHQYLMAIEAANTPGWRPIDVRTRRRELSVRARTGYYAAAPRRATG
jgi:Ca-activated chloride channel family protein